MFIFYVSQENKHRVVPEMMNIVPNKTKEKN